MSILAFIIWLMLYARGLQPNVMHFICIALFYIGDTNSNK